MKLIEFNRVRHLFQNSDFRFSGHIHEKYEANLILKGTVELTCGSNVFLLGAGQFAIWKPGVFHMSKVTASDGAELIAFDFDLADDDFPKSESDVFTLGEGDMLLVKLVEEEGIPVPSAVSFRLFEAFLMRLERQNGVINLLENVDSVVYRDAVIYMNRHLNENVNVRAIAKHCGVCLTTLKNAFRVCSGKGVKSYFMDMKFERAKEMLMQGIRVAEISDELAFSSPAYFSQSFKNQTGISPREFKRIKDLSRHRNKENS